ncbi:hypothetical protein Angca_003611 [Angiostrongylus cantonensis]|nr:hypothetical protein Angca_003611 [Angiostrongylus cantonensis]
MKIESENEGILTFCKTLPEISFLRDCGVFESHSLLVVPDACEDVGSAGSALNALLITYMCAQQGYSVLNESLLESSRILILLLGASSESFPLGAAFKPTLKILETPWIVPDYPIAHTILNANRLATNSEQGVWICGTDAQWKIADLPKFAFDPDEMAAFYFQGRPQHAYTHGVYELDEQNRVRSLSYRCAPCVDSPSVVLGLAYLPPALSIRFLALHSIYPISRSTYYGIDNGALGLKLSLFFDVILATCKSEDQFVSSLAVTEKSDNNHFLLEQSRREIWKRFNTVTCRAYCLPLIEYEYLSEIKKEQTKITKLVMVDTLQGTTLRLMLKMIARDGGQYSTIILMTLMALVKYYGVKLDILNEIESLCMQSVPRCSRALMLAAEYLALAAQGRGGLRSGPAANPSFTYVFDQIKAEPNGEQVRELFRIVREQWLHSETEMIRAARHLEAAAQIYTRLEVERICQRHIPCIPVGIDRMRSKSVIVEAAARVDLFGGWLDTPPITLHAKPSAVVNMAILVDDMKPITCKVSRCCIPGITVKSEETTISFETSRSILDSHNKPGNPGALLCACLVCVGIPKRPDDNLPEVLQSSFSSTGLQIECHSSLPHGSGLGTSSILAAAVIRALWLTAGVNHSEKNVCHAVLMVEQLLTTGGGWQDQVGCLYPGIKKGIFSEEESSIDVEQIPISQYFEDDINRRMALIYTGKTRLAKNLLQEVIRGWYSGGPTRDVIASLENNVELFSDALRAGHMPCDLIDLYYEAKKALATGCEPEVVTSLIFRLKTEKLIDTAWLAGAGGGGFLYAWLRKDVTADQIRTYISDCGCFEMSVHTITIDNSPMNVYLT